MRWLSATPQDLKELRERTGQVFSGVRLDLFETHRSGISKGRLRIQLPIIHYSIPVIKRPTSNQYRLDTEMATTEYNMAKFHTCQLQTVEGNHVAITSGITGKATNVIQGIVEFPMKDNMTNVIIAFITTLLVSQQVPVDHTAGIDENTFSGG